MSEELKEIPQPMLDAATEAVMRYVANLNACSLQLTDEFYSEMIEAALEAAGVPKMAARIAGLEAKLREVVQSKDVAMPIEMDEEITELLKPKSAEVSE